MPKNKPPTEKPAPDLPTLEDAKRRLWEVIQTAPKQNPLDRTAEALIAKAGLKRGRLASKALKQLGKDGNIATKTIEYEVHVPATADGLATIATLGKTGMETLNRTKVLLWTIGFGIFIALTVAGIAQDETEAADRFDYAFFGMGLMMGLYAALMFTNFSHVMADTVAKLRAHMGTRYRSFVVSTIVAVAAGLGATWIIGGIIAEYLNPGETVTLCVTVFAFFAPAGWFLGKEIAKQRRA